MVWNVPWNHLLNIQISSIHIHLRLTMTIQLEQYRYNHVCRSLSDLMAAVTESSAAMGMERRDWLKDYLATISGNHELLMS